MTAAGTLSERPEIAGADWVDQHVSLEKGLLVETILLNRRNRRKRSTDIPIRESIDTSEFPQMIITLLINQFILINPIQF